MICIIPLVAGIAFCITSTATAANIVQNYGFETGDFTGWTVNSGSDHPWIVRSGSGAFQGTFFAGDGCIGAQCITGTSAEQASLSQTLATIAGMTYTLNFQFTTEGNGAPNELDVLWNGVSVLDLGPGGTLGPLDTFTTYTFFTVPNLVATSSSTVLTFLGRQDPSYNGLDNVEVIPTGLGPEPATVLMMTSLLPLAFYFRRRRS